MTQRVGDEGIKSGRYRHYKGAYYVVYGTVRHSETEELLVLYRTDYQDNNDESHWVRPFNMFIENILIDGVVKPRFEFIERV